MISARADIESNRMIKASCSIKEKLLPFQHFLIAYFFALFNDFKKECRFSVLVPRILQVSVLMFSFSQRPLVALPPLADVPRTTVVKFPV